ncbi:prephenate dehydrogenase [Fructilactobacillus cliffordii]|uniref:prephenate dehydrogenase n=1 Tax=Fructilactobacillus cliffordii TaxID=2940299 RepID=UPI0020939814|nr:prephenate dehydrogenase [Fructilactobacillus cliffordii]USS86070.1 prephenate dehydrogenase [Fructilactobacillus cliffordii]
MTTVFIHGFGLLGSSLARVLRQEAEPVTIIGSDHNPAQIEYAREHQLLDQTSTGLERAPEADVIILATPVDQIKQTLRALAKLPLQPGVIVTDVGSTKQSVVKASQALAATPAVFVGGHPMAGSHKTGARAGRADLFENAFYFQTPQSSAERAAAQQLQHLLAGTKVKFVQITPERHDRLVGQVSHLPHVLAAGLVNQSKQALQSDSLGLRVAAGGFKSMTRIAAADPTMWQSILLNNGPVVSDQVAAYIETLQRVQTAINQQDGPALWEYFQSAQQSRQQLEQQDDNQGAGFYDLFLDIPDQPGTIARVTTLLAQAHLNLVNLQILEVREDVNGILQLTFSTAADAQRAETALAPEYHIVRRD